MADIDLKELRQSYSREILLKSSVDPNPLAQFKYWFDEATNAKILEPNAMTLATSDKEGLPSARTVLLKGVEQGGFVFFTNYESRKSQELDENPKACLLFTWLELERQVRIEGRVEKISAEASTAYFQSRPRGSQIGAWASPQSSEINDREEMEELVAALEKKYEGEDALPRPPHWGGFKVVPTEIEFWQGRENRLHDRICYRLNGSSWEIVRLAPSY